MKKECTSCKSFDNNNKIYMEYNNVTLCHDCFNKFYKGFNHLDDNITDNDEEMDYNSLTPKSIYEELSKFIISQDEAKKTFATSIVQHYKKLNQTDFNKSNILLMGPSGTGKTEIARVVSKILKVPFLMSDASNLTASGYIGGSAEDIIRELYIASNYNVKAAEKAIVFVDEIDKLAQFSNGNANNSRVKSSDVQREFLKILEGKEVHLKFPEGDKVRYVTIDTSNILFICAGAFVGMEEIIKKRMKLKNTIGLSAPIKHYTKQKKDEYLIEHLSTEDLKNYGFIPEIIGRLPIRTFTKPLKSNDLLNILTEPETSIIKEFKKLFSLDEVNVYFSKKYLNEVVHKALKEKTGARGLRSIIQKDVDKKYFTIDQYKGKKIKF